MRLHAEGFSEEEHGEFQRRSAADPRYAAGYTETEEVWTFGGLLPQTSAPELRNHTATRPFSRRHRGQKGQARVIALVLFMLSMVGYFGWLQGWIPSNYQRYEVKGNIRHVVPSDGSEVGLDLNAQLSFANFKDIRRVSLDRGEAYFRVTHDNTYPPVAKAGNGSTIVTGTRLNVWRYQDNMVVTVTGGSVKIHSKGLSNDSNLISSMQASYYPGLPQSLVEAVDTRWMLAWCEGYPVFDDLLPSRTLSLINRHLDAPLVLSDRSAAKLRVGGIYNTCDIRSLVDVLPKVLSVDLEHREDGSICIGSRYVQL